MAYCVCFDISTPRASKQCNFYCWQIYIFDLTWTAQFILGHSLAWLLISSPCGPWGPLALWACGPLCLWCLCLGHSVPPFTTIQYSTVQCSTVHIQCSIISMQYRAIQCMPVFSLHMLLCLLTCMDDAHKSIGDYSHGVGQFGHRTHHFGAIGHTCTIWVGTLYKNGHYMDMHTLTRLLRNN